MELWIRSQDKELLQKCDGFGIQQVGEEDLFKIFSNGYYLGEYSSKERCMEILDEIDTFKEYMIMYEYQNKEYKDRIRLFLENKEHTLGTYLMPSE